MCKERFFEKSGHLPCLPKNLSRAHSMMADNLGHFWDQKASVLWQFEKELLLCTDSEPIWKDLEKAGS